MGNRVHSGLVSSRQGGRHSTIVSCRGPMSHSTRTWFRMCSGTRCSHQRRTLAMSSSGSPGIWSVFQAVADVGGAGGPVSAGDLLRSRLQVSWPKWPTWPGQSLRLPKITAIEQRNRKDHPSERAVTRNPGFAGRRFRNSLQIRPHSEHDLEQIQVRSGTNRGLRFASLGRPLAIAPVSGPGIAVNRGAEMAVQEILKGLPAGLHVGDNPFPFGRANKEFSPLDDDNASPELRRSGHGQMMTLPDRKVPQPTPGLLGLAYVAEPGSWEVDAIERRADRG